MSEVKNQDTGLTTPDLILTMLRTQGYKSSSYALAELVDNSIDAKAENITISVATETIKVRRTSERIKGIGVYDDGSGMDPQTLRNCIRVGWGTNLGESEDSTLGKFGFGLKGAALAFCKRLEVYSWQNGGEPLFTFLDYNERIANPTNDLFDPIPRDPRKVWPSFVPKELPPSGTLVVWTEIDRLDQARAPTLLDEIDQNFCRIFRHFMDHDDSLGERKNIQVVHYDPLGQEVTRKTLTANDPIYRLTPNNTPGFENEQTNEVDVWEKIEVVGSDGKTHVIEMIGTIAFPEIQKGESLTENMGNTPLGRHYGKNEGISFVRAGREITLSTKGFFPTDPRNRWIGVEVRVPPALDDYFGITNDKQNVTAFKNFSPAQIEAMEDDVNNEDPFIANKAKAQLDLHRSIAKFIERATQTVKKRGSGQRTGGGGGRTTVVPKGLGDNDTPTKSKKDAKTKDEATKIEELKQAIRDEEPELPDDEVSQRALAILAERLNLFESDWPGEMFLEVSSLGNRAAAKVNRKHKFYELFYDYLKGLSDDRAIIALQAIIVAYARAEDTLFSQIESRHFETLRIKWGAYVNEYINEFME